jgi:hypothetical protein
LFPQTPLISLPLTETPAASRTTLESLLQNNSSISAKVVSSTPDAGSGGYKLQLEIGNRTLQINTSQPLPAGTAVELSAREGRIILQVPATQTAQPQQAVAPSLSSSPPPATQTAAPATAVILTPTANTPPIADSGAQAVVLRSLPVNQSTASTGSAITTYTRSSLIASPGAAAAASSSPVSHTAAATTAQPQPPAPGISLPTASTPTASVTAPSAHAPAATVTSSTTATGPTVTSTAQNTATTTATGASANPASGSPPGQLAPSMSAPPSAKAPTPQPVTGSQAAPTGTASPLTATPPQDKPAPQPRPAPPATPASTAPQATSGSNQPATAGAVNTPQTTPAVTTSTAQTVTPAPASPAVIANNATPSTAASPAAAGTQHTSYVVEFKLQNGPVFTARADQPLAANSVVVLKATGQTLTATPIRQPDTNLQLDQTLRDTLRSVLPQQLPLASNLNQIQSLASQQTASQLPALVRSMLTLFGVRPGASDTPQQLRNNVQFGGQHTEAALAKGDVQSLRSDLRHQIKQLQQQAQELPREQRQLMEQLIQSVQARITHNQIAALQQSQEQPDGGSERVLLVDIPVVREQRLDNLELRISHEQASSEQGEAQSLWRVKMRFDLEESGTVDAEVKLAAEEQLHILFWSSLKTTKNKLDAALESFSTQLVHNGFTAPEVVSYLGEAPASRPAGMPKNLVDIRT